MAHAAGGSRRGPISTHTMMEEILCNPRFDIPYFGHEPLDPLLYPGSKFTVHPWHNTAHSHRVERRITTGPGRSATSRLKDTLTRLPEIGKPIAPVPEYPDLESIANRALSESSAEPESVSEEERQIEAVSSSEHLTSLNCLVTVEIFRT